MASTDGSTIEEITYDYHKDGEQVRMQMAKEIVTVSPVWATIAFLHRSLDIGTSEWKPLQITVARFKKAGGIWRKESAFNINNLVQLDKLLRILNKFRALMR